MKNNPLFEQCVANVAPEVMEEVNLNIDIANRIYDLLKAKNMTQREFASRMGKRESEISRWLTGSHGFTTTTLAKMSAVLGESIVEVKRKVEEKYVFTSVSDFLKVPQNSYVVNFNRDYHTCPVKIEPKTPFVEVSPIMLHHCPSA